MSESETTVPPVAVLQYGQADPLVRRWPVRVAGWAACLAVAVCVIGTIAQTAFGVRSVMKSGPALFIVAVVMLTTAAVANRWWWVAIAAGHMCVCGLFVGLVYAFNFGPTRATAPFAAMSLIWTVLSTALTIFTRHDGRWR